MEEEEEEEEEETGWMDMEQVGGCRLDFFFLILLDY